MYIIIITTYKLCVLEDENGIWICTNENYKMIKDCFYIKFLFNFTAFDFHKLNTWFLKSTRRGSKALSLWPMSLGSYTIKCTMTLNITHFIWQAGPCWNSNLYLILLQWATRRLGKWYGTDRLSLFLFLWY